MIIRLFPAFRKRRKTCPKETETKFYFKKNQGIYQIPYFFCISYAFPFPISFLPSVRRFYAFFPLEMQVCVCLCAFGVKLTFAPPKEGKEGTVFSLLIIVGLFPFLFLFPPKLVFTEKEKSQSQERCFVAQLIIPLFSSFIVFSLLFKEML